MTTVLIVIHLMVVLTMIGLVLLQRSEGGALGIGGGSGGFMSGRGAGNVLTRTTAVLAAVFFLTSVGLSILARMESRPADILDRLPAGSVEAPAAPAPAPFGAPESAQDLLESLGGPQTPPPAAGEPAAPPSAGSSGAPAAAPPADAPPAGGAPPQAPAAPTPAAPAAPDPAPAAGGAE